MEWDSSTKEDMPGSSVGFAESTIMSYLGLTEDKTTELLSIQAFLNSKVNSWQVGLSCLLLQQLNYSKNAFLLLSKDADRNNPKDLAKFLLSENSEQLLQQISFQPAVNMWVAYIFSNLYWTFAFGMKTAVWPVMSRMTALLSADYETDEAPLTDEEEWPISQEELRKKISKQVGGIIQSLAFPAMLG